MKKYFIIFIIFFILILSFLFRKKTDFKKIKVAEATIT